MDLNCYIKKSHLRMVEKFNEELRAFAEETDEFPPVLYEDAFTYFTLWNVRVEDGWLIYDYNDRTERDRIVLYDDEEQTYYEDDWMEGIPQAIRFWRSCIRKARRYNEMDLDKLNDIYDFKREDIQDDEEDN